MSNEVDLFVNGSEVGGFMEWTATFEEILGGQGSAQITLQDRTNTYEPQCHWDVKAVVHATGHVLFRGEIISPPVALLDGEGFRRWKLSCVDYNYELDWRLVGAVDGKTWIDEDGFGDFIPIDPYANSLADDKQTVQALFDHYIRVAGEAIGTDTFVVPNLSPGSFTPIFWNRATLRSALDDLASLVTNNLQYGIDPDLELHWTPIPSWTDLAETPSTTIFPTEAITSLATAPRNIDNDNPVDGVSIGCSGLSWTPDGQNMPQQVYVNGATGFAYSNGVGEFSTGDVGGPVPAGKYQVTVIADTNLYSADSTGYILDDLTPPQIPAGQVGYADVVHFPRKPTGEHHGGSFYKLVTGPYAGGYISTSTDGLGYGQIDAIIAPLPAAPGPPPDPVPVIGTGGSGWANDVAQDPNLRQQYFDAPLSLDRATRDSIGGQQLYRGANPTLRGTFLLTGKPDQEVDGWRAWQVFTLTDQRLPESMNGKEFLIQSVRISLLEGGTRQYSIDYGDGPVQRSAASPSPRPRVPDPAVQVLVTAPDLGPAPGDSQVITAQLTDRSGNAWAVPGKTMDFSLAQTDGEGNPIDAGGTLDPMVAVTDRAGTAHTTLTAGDLTNVKYTVTADVAVS